MMKSLAIPYDGSTPLKNAKHERYARFRAAAMPRNVAFRKVYRAANDNVVDANACRLEKKPGVRERIDYLVGQAQDRVVDKRVVLEEALWNIHEADPGMFWETIEIARTGKDGKLATDETGRMATVRKQRPRLINDLPLEARKLIEDVTVDKHGNYVPRLYSRAEASRDLRKMHNFDRQEQPKTDDISRLSDAELIAQLSDTAKELGIDINLNYSFAQQSSAGDPAPPKDVTPPETDKAAGGTAADAADAADVAAAAELKIAAQPVVAGARPVEKFGRD